MFSSKCPIKTQAQYMSSCVAIVADKDIITFKQLDVLIDNVALALKNQGVSYQNRVAFHAPCQWQTLLLFFAIYRLQATACPLSTRLPQENIEKMLMQMNAAFYIDVDTLFIQKLPRHTQVDFSSLPPIFSLMASSGSTGQPKLIAHSIENFYYSAIGTNWHLSLAPSHRWLLSLPLYHVGGLSIAFRCILSGATICFSKLSLQESVQKEKITHLSLVPTQLYRLLNDPIHLDLSSVKGILVGGAPLSKELYTTALRANLPIFPTYGMTEMSSQITMDSTLPSPDSLSSGKPLLFREIKISPQGEILVKGPTLFRGYWTVENHIHLPLEKDSWFATGDIGTFTSNGELLVTGRKDNMFISGGENIHPEEIERELCNLPGIQQAIVIPIEDPEFGQRPIAFLESNNSCIPWEEYKEILRSKLPGFYVPSQAFAMPPFLCKEMKISRLKLKEYWRINKPSNG